MLTGIVISLKPLKIAVQETPAFYHLDKIHPNCSLTNGDSIQIHEVPPGRFSNENHVVPEPENIRIIGTACLGCVGLSNPEKEGGCPKVYRI